MPFLEDLILGKPGSDRRRRYTEDTSLTGGGDTGLGGFGALSLLRPRRRVIPERTAEEVHASERKSCGSLVCSSVWAAPWRSRAHPMFEGQWACSSRCLSAMVRSALAREAGEEGYDDGPEPHHHRIPLGLVMLAQGWITHPQLQKALEAQRAHGSGRIGEWLVSECGIRPERIARGLGVQWNCPVLSTESFWPEAMALVLPRVFLEEYGVIPLRVAGRKILYIGFQDYLDASASFALEQMTGLRTESGVLPEVEFSDARETLLRCEFPHHTISAVSDRDGLARAVAETVEQEKPEASRLVRLHHYYWLRVWAKRQDSRPDGDVPEMAESVKDCLFTIGSRLPRWVQEDRTKRLIAGPKHEVTSEPALHAVAEPEDDPLSEVAAAEAASEAGSSETVRSAIATAEEREIEFEGVDSGPEAAPEPLRHFLVKLESPPGRIIGMDLAEFEETQQISQPVAMERSLQKSVETIEGEYLTTDLAIVSSSALLAQDQPTRLNRLGRMLRLKPSFPYRKSGPASGRDQAV